MTLTPAKLEELGVLAAAATEGPWQRSGVRQKVRDEDCIMVGPDGFLIIALPIGSNPKEHAGAFNDAAFIAACSPDVIMGLLAHIAAQAEVVVPKGIYVASRTRHGDMWKSQRESGFNIISSWIDECGAGETEDFTELWDRIFREVGSAKALVLYIEPEDFPLKGALVEVGAALILGKPVILCAPSIEAEGRTMRPFGSWILHKNVVRVDNLKEALYAAAAPSLTPLPTPPSPAATEATEAGDMVAERNYDAEMKLPPGKTCEDCAHSARCFAFGFSTPGCTSCDFWPSSYRARMTAVQNGEG